jgi:hypothetical protein
MAMDKICKIDGCGNPKDSLGLCKLHAARMRRHGDPLAGRTKEGAPAAFIERAINYEGDECLIWPFSKTKGYAAMRKDGRLQYVSRIICERLMGRNHLRVPRHFMDAATATLGALPVRT